MTQDQAKAEMLKYGRNVVAPEFANEIAQAFNESLESLGLHSHSVDTFSRLNYHPDSAKCEAISMCEVARSLALKKTGTKVYSDMNGAGSYADDITQKSIALL